METYNKVIIMGYGKSGKAVEQVLIKEKVKYLIFDESNIPNAIHKLNKNHFKDVDLVVISPAISIFNKWVRYAKRKNIRVISELEFGFEHLKYKPKIIAITGTNGKTTTTKLINDVILSNGFKSVAVGNIGLPLTSVCETKYDYLVCEVSSFQLEAVDKFAPNVCVLLNVAEDHLDRHKTFKNYINSKFELFKNKPNLSILNFDDYITSINTFRIEGDKTFFSKTGKCDGLFLDENDKVLNANNELVFDMNNLDIDKIFYDDILATLCVCEYYKLDFKCLTSLSKKYKNMTNKREILANIPKFVVINDSKATNIHAMQNSLKLCKTPTVLLIGGVDKKLNFDAFFNASYMYNLKAIIVYGNVRKRVLKSAKKFGFTKIVETKNLGDAVEMGVDMLEENDTLLFSPACSSFDEFSGYEERGEFFKNKVLSLLE